MHPVTPKKIRALLLWTLILSACSLGIPATRPPPSPTAVVLPASPTPTATADAPQNCGYQWAYQDLPELSGSLQQSVEEIQPGAQARAYAFGENCVLADGSVARFSPMETDFDIRLQVGDITDEASLGEWIVRMMEIIESIPTDQIVGPRPGRVSITFEAAGEQSVINFYIEQYQALPPGLSHVEIYQSLRTPQ
jgi:hypothetical protein